MTFPPLSSTIYAASPLHLSPLVLHTLQPTHLAKPELLRGEERKQLNVAGPLRQEEGWSHWHESELLRLLDRCTQRANEDIHHNLPLSLPLPPLSLLTVAHSTFNSCQVQVPLSRFCSVITQMTRIHSTLLDLH